MMLLNISSFYLREHIEIFLTSYVFVVILYFFGIGKNFVALLVFLLYDLNQKMIALTLNGGDNLTKFILLYMIFANTYEYFSVKKASYTSRDTINFLSNIARWSICIHLCWAYFISAVHKIHADVWFNGIATYYILSLERYQGTTFNHDLARNGLFVTLTTYFTIIVELFFPVLIWNKTTRPYFIVAGILLHTGIFFFMMLYDFQLLFIATYGFFFTDSELTVFFSKIKYGVFKRFQTS
jgi:hypothetical protein